jgi:hypothetical protein
LHAIHNTAANHIAKRALGETADSIGSQSIESDSFFLNNAVHLLEDNLKKTRNPHSDATFDFGPRKPHCYTGALPEWDESEGLDLNQRVLPLMIRHMLETAPTGADTKSWVY